MSRNYRYLLWVTVFVGLVILGLVVFEPVLTEWSIVSSSHMIPYYSDQLNFDIFICSMYFAVVFSFSLSSLIIFVDRRKNND